MAETTPEQFAAARRAIVVAPAGCGKTELIVRAIGADTGQRDLVLTHTHAGIRAAAERLRQIRIPSSRYKLDTIAGWALHIAASYPALSGLTDAEPEAAEWNEVYAAAARLLAVPTIQTVLKNSYSGVYVDEYQDCTKDQHSLIRALAELLPCRAVGDPLQSIFDFGGEGLVDWEGDVYGLFDPLPDLVTPHRWAAAPKLGNWLMHARQQLLANEPVDLSGSPVALIPPNPKEISNALRRLRGQTSASVNVVAITGFAAQAHAVAQQNDGYHALEPVDCPDLLQWTRTIDDAAPLMKAQHVLQIAKQCFTQVSDLAPEIAAIERGKPFKPGSGKFAAVRRAVITLIDIGTPDALAALIERVNEQCAKQGRLYRREAWTDFVRSARAFEQAQQETFREAAWARRQVLRSSGRRASTCCVGRPVLIKGLQFTHAIALNPRACSREELYVSLTRGRLSLGVVTSEQELRPKSR